jgi:hypothetical protein
VDGRCVVRWQSPPAADGFRRREGVLDAPSNDLLYAGRVSGHVIASEVGGPLLKDQTSAFGSSAWRRSVKGRHTALGENALGGRTPLTR